MSAYEFAVEDLYRAVELIEYEEDPETARDRICAVINRLENSPEFADVRPRTLH